MKKNDIFTFTALNGVEVTAVVLDKQLIENSIFFTKYQYICYAQNRLFYYMERYFPDVDKIEYEIGNTIVDHVIIPDYDRMLTRHNDIEIAQTETSAGM